MTGPVGLAAAIGDLMLLVTLASIVRIAGARFTRTATDWSVDGCHAVMGVSMAGMLIPSLGIVEPGASTWAWVVVSALIAAWFAVSVVRDLLTRHPDRLGRVRRLHHLPHLVLSGAMVYMLVALAAVGSAATTSGGGMSGMGAATTASGGGALPLPTLDLALAAFMVGYAVVLIDRLPAIARLGGVGEPVAIGPGSTTALFAPRSAAVVGVVMASGMAYMLVMMFV